MTRSIDPDTIREHHKAMERRIPRRPEWDRLRSRKEEDMATIIELPRRLREGSVTAAQMEEVLNAFSSGEVGPKEAVVVVESVEKEATARNRAGNLRRAIADKYPDAPALRSHAIKVGDTWTGAISLKPVEDMDDTTPANPDDDGK